MRYLYYTLISSISFLFIHCASNKKTINETDRKQIETLLSKQRRYAFMDLYERSIKKEEKKYQIKKTDSLFDLSSTELYHENCLRIDFYSKEHPSYTDDNYVLMIDKWLKKDYPPEMPTDNPNIKTTMTLKKALDFYESTDLNKYVDSLRAVFYKKHEEHNLKSIKCVE